MKTQTERTVHLLCPAYHGARYLTYQLCSKGGMWSLFEPQYLPRLGASLREMGDTSMMCPTCRADIRDCSITPNGAPVYLNTTKSISDALAGRTHAPEQHFILHVVRSLPDFIRSSKRRYPTSHAITHTLRWLKYHAVACAVKATYNPSRVRTERFRSIMDNPQLLTLTHDWATHGMRFGKGSGGAHMAGGDIFKEVRNEPN